VRVNLGCGLAYMPGWVNVDESPDIKADIHLDAIDFIRQYGDQVEEIYMGHVLEHIMPGDSLVLLKLMNEKLPLGAVVSAVTPDMTETWAAYRAGEVSADDLNFRYIYSYEQPSHHVWCYDQDSLAELFTRAGYDDVESIDPTGWDPVYHKTGPESRWQCGVKATAKGVPVPDLGSPPRVRQMSFDEVFGVADQLSGSAPETGVAALAATREPAGAQETMLRRLQVLRDALIRETQSRELLQQEAEALRDRLNQLQPPAGAEAPANPGVPVPVVPKPVVPPEHADPIDPATLGLKGRLRERVKTKLPPGSRQREVARSALLTYRSAIDYTRLLKQVWTPPGAEPKIDEPAYADWLAHHRADAEQLAFQRAYADSLPDPVRVHLVVLPGEGPIARTVQSLTAQSWPHWRADILQGGITGGSPDERVNVAEYDGSPIDAANFFISEAPLDFIVLLRAGDVLAPDCVYSIATAAHQDPLIDVVSWDDDLISADDVRSNPRFRPARWSPELVMEANYLDRAFAIRRRRYLVTGGLRKIGSPDYSTEQASAASWDLLLRGNLDDERVGHVARVLSSVPSRPELATQQDVSVVSDHLDRVGWQATAEADADRVRLRWSDSELPRVSVIIPTRRKGDYLSKCLRTLAATDYPDFEVVVIDNGDKSVAEKQKWYDGHKGDLDLKTVWWDTTPFNYSQVNNAAVEQARGEVLVFLNDDTELIDPGWLRQVVGWALRPDVGVVGVQLEGPDGEIQHGGIVLGMGGFADHLFQGMRPNSDSLLGPTEWTRNVLAVTGACLTIRRELFDEVGGFDERFILCGSDVVLGLDMVLRGKRNVVTADTRIRHLESATRGTDIPRMDFFTSFWRYNNWLFGGDPYFSPNLSLNHREPTLKSDGEPTVAQRIGPILGHNFGVFRQQSSAADSRFLADICHALPADTDAVNALHAQNAAPFEVKSINWFIPGVDSPFYGGINTILRIADKLAREHGVLNRFVTFGEPNEDFIRSAVAAPFPALQNSEVAFYRVDSNASLELVPYADVSVATLWLTAYAVTHFPHTKRKFYIIQDYEPGFFPNGTEFGLAEETYNLGLYGLCNTENLRNVYHDEYGGKGFAFSPAVDDKVFHARWRHQRTPDAPATVFLYARPGMWRNCWELAAPALEELKRRLGDRVRIVAAGAWAIGAGAEADVKRLGLLDYKATGELYRHCDIGMALTLSRHPSYLPLELMACGVPVVAFDNPWGHWLLRDGENCLLAKRTADSLTDRLEKLVIDPTLRKRLAAQGLADIAEGYNDWDKALSGIYGYLCDPEGQPLTDSARRTLTTSVVRSS